MSGERELLAAELIGQPVVRDYYTLPITPRDAHLLADALLPVVDRIASERAAAELEAAADGPTWDLHPRIRARAAALRAATGEATT